MKRRREEEKRRREEEKRRREEEKRRREEEEEVKRREEEEEEKRRERTKKVGEQRNRREGQKEGGGTVRLRRDKRTKPKREDYFAGSWPFLTTSCTGGSTFASRFFRGGGFHTEPPSNILNSSTRQVSGESP